MLICLCAVGEVQALLTLWANPAVQKRLLNMRNNKAYA